jgi:hypothetical protein
MEVESKRQATVEYAFSPPETFASRPFGLTILLDYKDEVCLFNIIIPPATKL